MGGLDRIKIISRGFNFYFPMLICLLCLGTYFQLGSRCLHIFGVRQFFDEDEVSAEFIEDGKNLMKRGKMGFLDLELKKKKSFVERRNYGGMDTMASTTTTTQRRDRRRELEEKYGLKSMTNKNSAREENFTDTIAGLE